MNKTSLCIAILLMFGAAANAASDKSGKPTIPTTPGIPSVPALKEVGFITGVTISPANPIMGETVNYIVTMSGAGYCTVDLKTSSGVKGAANSAFANAKPATGVTISNNVVLPADTYTVKIEGSKHIANADYPACRGEASVTYVVTNPRIATKIAPNLTLMPAIIGLTGPDSFSTNEAGKLMVDGHGLCSYHVDFGDGKTEDRTDTLPIDLRSTAAHEYTNYGVPKTFTLKVKGVTNKCKGEFKKDVIVTAPNLTVAAPQASAIPATPTVKLACPPGKVC